MRHYRIFLILVVSTVLVAGLFANDIKYGADTLLVVPKTKIAPVIDGVMDPIWRGVSETWLTSFTNGTTPPDSKTDLYGSIKLMWDNTKIYGILTTYDDVLYNGMTNTYENDSWEFYFDADNSKGETYDGVNDVQLRVEWQKDVAPADVDGGGAATVLAAVQAEAEIAQVDFAAGDGYTVEFSIPLDAIQLTGADGTKFGFEAQQNDNEGTARDHISKWWAQSGDLGWANASVFGTAVLSALEVDTLVAVHKTATAPVIDGVMDEVWKTKSVGYSQTSYVNGTGLPADRDDLTGEIRLLWDNNKIYGLLTTTDDVLYNGMTNTYENDSWEFYFDADNSKGETYDGVNDVQLRVEWQKDVAPADIDGGGAAAVLAAVQAEAEIAQVDFASGGGYTVEFSIPLDAIQLTGADGTKFGFETQQNDNDGTARDHISKWWAQSGDLGWANASVFGTAVLLPEIVTAVPQQPVAMVNDYRLSQNYPNPFNPATKIDYTIAKAGMVKLSVYNLLGKEVATLVNGVKQVGTYSARFNAANLSSGIYFYKLQAGNTILTNKMVLLK